MKTATKARRRLPGWLAGGPEVTELAYRIVVVAFGDPPAPVSCDEIELDAGVGTTRIVAHLVDRLDADEYDVLLGLAELERAGVLVTKGQT